MKNFIDYCFGWLKVSNRMTHLKCGSIITAAMLVIFMLFSSYVYFKLGRDVRGEFAVVALSAGSFIALVTTWIAMTTVEYIQKKCGLVFDRKDIWAGILVPLVLFIISLLIVLTVL